jgi:hypothetical protein
VARLLEIPAPCHWRLLVWEISAVGAHLRRSAAVRENGFARIIGKIATVGRLFPNYASAQFVRLFMKCYGSIKAFSRRAN